MNRYDFKNAFIISFIFNIVLIFILVVTNINSANDSRQPEPPAVSAADTETVPEVSGTDVSGSDLSEVSGADTADEDVYAEPDGEDLPEVTTTAAVATTTATAEQPTTTTARKTDTTKKTTKKTTTSTKAPTTTTKKPTTTTKGSGDNDAEMDWSGFH